MADPITTPPAAEALPSGALYADDFADLSPEDVEQWESLSSERVTKVESRISMNQAVLSRPNHRGDGWSQGRQHPR